MNKKVYTVLDMYKEQNTVDVFTKVFASFDEACGYLKKQKEHWLEQNTWWNILEDRPDCFSAETNDYEYTQTLYVQESDFIY